MRTRTQAKRTISPLPPVGSAVRLRKHAGGPVWGTVVEARQIFAEQRGELLSVGLGVLVDWGSWYRSTEFPDDLAVTA